MVWDETQHSAAPPPSTTAHLDRLAAELVREGWQVLRRYDEPRPLLRVFDADVPHFGESITLAPASGTWWFQSSTGEDLAPYDRPTRAAERISRILTPFVTAALAARTRQMPRPEHQDRPPDPDPSQSATIAEVRRRFTGVVCWWGTYTGEWWALVPGGTRWQIVNARDPDKLIQAVLNARPHV
jgi:hypothetical protein